MSGLEHYNWLGISYPYISGLALNDPLSPTVCSPPRNQWLPLQRPSLPPLAKRTRINIRSASAIALPVKLCRCLQHYTRRPTKRRIASPGTLPYAQNHPQKCKYELYNEGVCWSRFMLNFVSYISTDNWQPLRWHSTERSQCVKFLSRVLSARIKVLYVRFLYRIRPSVAHQGFKPLPPNLDVSLRF